MPKAALEGKLKTFVLFGATGDLAVQKIFPALDSLYRESLLGGMRVIAVSRRDWDNADFLSFLREKNGYSYDAGFLASIGYARVEIGERAGYDALKSQIEGAPLVYLSLAPEHHAPAIEALRDSGILAKGSGKLLVEKPFGTDERSACALDRLLSFLDPAQVCRVDHYLGKDTVRAIMDLHERTEGFERLLSAESVESIRARIFETKDIGGRGVSYDGVGAFRDVGQNHLLEMLAVVAAEPTEGHKSWQAARADILKRLAPPEKTCALSRRGQYEGYLSEPGVRPGSETETAFEVVTSFSSGKLSGVPLILDAGKRMPSSGAMIEVAFKEVSGLPRSMRFSIQPEQEIAIENRDGSRDVFEIPRARDAYASVILAALSGSSREFVGSEEIEALWRYADRIVACWGKVPLETYGTDRPFLIK